MCYECIVCHGLLHEPADEEGEETSMEQLPISSSSSSSSLVFPCKKARRDPLNGSHDDDYAVVTKCGHLFHNSCILKWFRKCNGNPTCPNCRRNSTIEELRRLYPHINDDKEVALQAAIQEKNNVEVEKKALKEEICNLKLAGAAAQEEMNIKYVDLQSQNSSLAKSHEELKKKFSELESETKSIKEEQIKGQGMLAEKTQLLAQTTADNSKLQTAVVKLKSTNKQIKDNAAKLKVELSKVIEDMKGKNQKLKVQVTKTMASQQQLNYKVSKLESTNLSLTQTQDKLNNKCKELETENKLLKEESKKSNLLLAENCAEINKYQHRIVKLKYQISSLTTSKAEVSGKCKELESRNILLSKEQIQLSKKVEQLDLENKRLKEVHIKVILAKKNALLTETNKLGLELLQLKSTNGELQKMVSDLESNNVRITKELELQKIKSDQNEPTLELCNRVQKMYDLFKICIEDPHFPESSVILQLFKTYITRLEDFQCKFHGVVEELSSQKNVNNINRFDTMLLQQKESNLNKLFSQVKTIHSKCHEVLEMELQNVFKQFQVVLSTLELENQLVQTAENLETKAMMVFKTLDIDGKYDVISQLNYNEYLKALGMTYDVCSSTLNIPNGVQVRTCGPSTYEITSHGFHGDSNRWKSTSKTFNLGETFVSTLECCSPDDPEKLCKTLITNVSGESETKLLLKQEQIYNGQVWVTKRLFHPAGMKIRFYIPAGQDETTGLMCMLAYNKRK